MDLSLSIVLPVHNAENTLIRTVHRLLELAPDITPRFEILIVDDASTDQTEEIAHELALEYPQIRITRHHTQQGQAAAVQTALTQSTGDVVFVQEEEAEIRCTELKKLWDMRHDQDLVMARAEMPRKIPNPHLLNRLAGWGEQLRNAASSPQGGIQMIRREALADLDHLPPQSHNVRFCNLSRPNYFKEAKTEELGPPSPVAPNIQAQ